jgi:hypothetical protein
VARAEELSVRLGQRVRFSPSQQGAVSSAARVHRVPVEGPGGSDWRRLPAALSGRVGIQR